MITSRYKFALDFVWRVCSSPDETLQYESLLNTFYGKNVFKKFIMPLAEILLIVGFVFSFFWIEMEMTYRLIRIFFDYIAFLMSYCVLFWVVRLVTFRFFTNEVSNRNFSILVASLMVVVFVVKFLQLLLPNMFFISFFYVYVFYLVWLMSEGLVDISEDNRNNFGR